MRKKRWKKHGAGLGWTAAVFALVFSLVLFGLRDTGGAVDESGLREAEQAVRRAAVTCYALEGAYPESYDYLKNHYGVRINESRYAVHYSVFASNLMPDITVTKRESP